MKPQTLLAVAFGGLFGGLARAALVQVLAPLGFDMTILLINIVGCALVAYFLGSVRSKFADIQWNNIVRPFFVTGILGGFTTTSAFAVIAASNMQEQQIYAFFYMLISVVGGSKLYEFVFKKVSP
jgi:CrcB protein